MKSFSKIEIQELANNSADFKEAIIDSKGFILYLADKYTIELSPTLLVDSITPYSIRFISEHMRTHKYSAEQSEIIIPYLTEDLEDSISAPITEYNLNDLLKDIKDDNNLPRNVNDLIKISFEDFLSYPKEFISLIYRSNDDYWGSDPFFASNFLLAPVFKNLTKEQFLEIDKNTLSLCPALFHMSNHLMNDDDIRNLFNESVTQYYQRPEVKKSGYKAKLENYSNYEFRENEKDLFLSLLKNDYSKDYERTKKYNGFDKFFTKEEYIFNYNISGIRYLSEKEIADNLSTIRSEILNAYINRHYQSIEELYTLRISKDSFKDIFSSDFVEDIIKISGGFYFHYYDKDNAKKSEFMDIIHQKVLTLCSENKDILNLVGTKNCIKQLTYILKEHKSYFNDTYGQAALGILSQFDEAIKTPFIFENFNTDKYNKIDCFSQYEVPKLIFENMNGKESINYLFALIRIHEDTDNYQKKSFKEEIDRIIPLLHSQDVMTLGKILNYPVDTSLLKDNPRQDFDNNFLNFTPEIIKSMSFSNFSSIFDLSQEFKNAVLENNLDYLIIQDKLSHLESRYNRDFINNKLIDITDNQSSDFNFMKSFIDRNKDFILEHYFTVLVTHPLRESLIKIDTSLLEKDSFQKLESILENFNEKSLAYNRAYVGRDKLSKNNRKKIDKLREELSAEKTTLENQIKENLPNISFDFYSQKIKESDSVRAIHLYNVSQQNKSDYKLMIFDKIESLDFKSTKNLLTNKDFLMFLFEHKSTMNGEKDRSVIFNPKFSNKQNIELVENLLVNFNNQDLFLHQYHDKVGLSPILYLIKKEKRFSISNDLAVKHDGVNLFNSYDYCPGGVFEKHVKHRFSNEQILQAIDNLNSQGLKIISCVTQNLSHDNLLSHNFEYKTNNKIKDRKNNPYLNDYLDLLKSLEKDPINYLACVHADIVQNFTDNEKFSHNGWAITEFYNKYINLDIVIEGMKQIFSIHKEMKEDKNTIDNSFYKGIAVRNAVNAVSNFIAYTSSSYENKVYSELSEDKSRKIFKFLVEEAPYLLLSFTSIGKISHTSQEMAVNFPDYYHKNFIDDFFLYSPKSQLTSDYFSLNYEKKSEYWQSGLVDNLITTVVSNLSERQEAEGIYKLDFIIKENQFNDQRPYGKKLYEFESALAEFLNHKEYEQLIEKSLGYIKMIELSQRLENKSKLKEKTKKI